MLDFAGLTTTPVIEQAFEHDGIREPSPVQQAAIGQILAGHHVVLQSGTGTGKTLAYLLPILQRLAASPEGRTVVITPSAELAIQILGVARRYKEPSVTVAGVVAGGSHKNAKNRLQKSTRLVVGSPGRILELFSQRKLKGVTTLVLDEPDPILVGDTPTRLRELLSRPEPKVQLIIVGATLETKAENLIRDVVPEHVVRVHIPDAPLRNQIAHRYVRVAPQSREVDLARFLERERCERAIVFLEQGQRIRHLYRYLTEHGHSPVTVSDERSKQERRAALDAFMAGRARVLITTDSAARGIDIPEVDWVLHYELPSSAPGYVHRAGRTGRAGRDGVSVAFVSPQELGVLQRYARELGIESTSHAFRE
jgi:superfamily II DNA/RNA helicase